MPSEQRRVISEPFTEIKAVPAVSQGEYNDVLLLSALHSRKPFFVKAFADPFGVFRLPLQATECSYYKV